VTDTARKNWQGVQREVLRRIHAREWKPGELIPNEADLATELGCARTTVNRALRSVAETGLLDRRRKAGTRVALQPTAKATLSIPVIRREVEDKGARYGYSRLSRRISAPPPAIAAVLAVTPHASLLHLTALHLADDTPYAVEDRWINLASVPGAADQTFEDVSGNEWLLANAAYTHGEIAFSAVNASVEEAELLAAPAGSALFVVNRLTWDHGASVTKVRLAYAPGHQIQAAL
jgi:GntR family histidine utilization transcriptional repressor